MINWHLEKRKLKDLKPLENNPNIHTKENEKEIVEDIKKTGFHDIFKIDTDNTILSGNLRQLVKARKNPEEEVNVIVPDRKLTERERKLVIIQSNKGRGEDDLDILGDDYKDILEELGYEDLLPEEEIEVVALVLLL